MRTGRTQFVALQWCLLATVPKIQEGCAIFQVAVLGRLSSVDKAPVWETVWLSALGIWQPHTLTFRSLHVEQPKRDLPFDFRPFLAGPLDGGLGTPGSEMCGDIWAGIEYYLEYE